MAVRVVRGVCGESGGRRGEGTNKAVILVVWAVDAEHSQTLLHANHLMVYGQARRPSTTKEG